MVLPGWSRVIGTTRMSHRTMRGRMVRQMAAMIRHDPVQFIPTVEDVLPVVAVGVEMPVPDSIRLDYPDIRVTTDEHHIVVDYRGDVDVAWHWLICLFDDHRRWRRGRRECAC